MSGYKYQKVWDQIEEEMILENNKQKWLLLQMQGNLNFNTYIYIYISSLWRSSNFVSIEQRRVLMKSFINRNSMVVRWITRFIFCKVYKVKIAVYQRNI